MLYYIRQKQSYLTNKFDMRPTCISCHMNTFFCTQFEEFKRLKACSEKWKDICVLQLLEAGLRHGIKCHELDRIYMSVTQPNEHQFLAEARLKEWSIQILDSLYIARKKQARIDLVRPLVEMLPHTLDDVHFFDVRPELNKRRGCPFSIMYGKNYPQQDR